MVTMPRILVTNDDSYVSPGLYLLSEALEPLGEVLIFSTEYPRSVIGHTITIFKPLRIYETRVSDKRVYVTDGTPVDVIHLAIDVLGYRPDLVVSGINVGENLTLQHIFYSGTVAAAIEASLVGIPSIAVSAYVSSFQEFNDPRLREIVLKTVTPIAEAVLRKGLPKNVDLLNVNIPRVDCFRNCVKVTRAARLRWRATYVRGRDPRNRPYYWLSSIPVDPEPGTDVYAVEVEGCVSITPISVDLNPCNVDPEEVAKHLGLELHL